MSTLEFFATIAFLDWCASHPPSWHPPRIPQTADPTKEVQGWMTKPWVAQAINQCYFILLAALIVITAVMHPAEMCNLKRGPLMLVPAYRVVVGLLPGYKPYQGAWDKVKEVTGKTGVQGGYERVREATGENPLIQGIIGPQGN